MTCAAQSTTRSACILGAAVLALCTSMLAQEAVPPEPDVRQLVWQYLHAGTKAEERGLEKRIGGDATLTLDVLLTILDRPPPLRPQASGRVDQVPFTIPGTRTRTTYELLVPRGYDPKKKLPLWIGIHGTDGAGENAVNGMAALAAANESVLIAAPTEAEKRRGKGWGYTHDERMLHVGVIDAVARRYPVDRDRVVIMGWSRGGHGAFDVSVRYPDLFAGVGPIIGSAPIRDLPLLRNLLGSRVMVINGGRDQAALVAAARRSAARLASDGVDVKVILDPERGHVGFLDRLPEMIAHLLPARREVAPAKLVFATWDKRYDRNRYVRVRKVSSKTYKPGRPIKARGASKMSQAERLDLIARHVDAHTATIEVEVASNEFRVRTLLVTRFELFLPLALIDFDQPVNITVNGKLKKKNLRVRKPSPVKLLKLMKEFGGADPAFRFAGKFAFSVR